MADAKVEVDIVSKGGVGVTGGLAGAGQAVDKKLGGIGNGITNMVSGIQNMLGPIAAIAGAVAILSKASGPFRRSIEQIGRLFMRLLKPIGDIFATVIEPFIRLVTPIFKFLTGVFKFIRDALKGLLEFFGIGVPEEQRGQTDLGPAAISIENDIEGFTTEFQRHIENTGIKVDESGNTLSDVFKGVGDIFEIVSESIEKGISDLVGDIAIAATDFLDSGDDAKEAGRKFRNAGSSMINWINQQFFKKKTDIKPEDIPGAVVTPEGNVITPLPAQMTQEGFRESILDPFVEDFKKMVKEREEREKLRGITSKPGTAGINVIGDLLSNLFGFNMGWLGFQHGGVVPGSGPVPIIAHGGETILPAGTSNSVNVNVSAQVLDASDFQSAIERFVENYMRTQVERF